VQPDGVHPNGDGHAIIAQLLKLSMTEPFGRPREPTAEIQQLVQQRMVILRDAYVAAAGHKRPGVAKGLPIDEANAKAAELTAKINSLLK
jgi:hypothetical protein